MGGKGGTDKKLFEFFIHRVLKTTSLSQSALSPIYIGLAIPGERLLPKLPKFGLVVCCIGIGRDFGAGLRLKLVVFPLNALKIISLRSNLIQMLIWVNILQLNIINLMEDHLI